MKKVLFIVLLVFFGAVAVAVVAVALAPAAGPVITESAMGHCLEDQGMSPHDASDGDSSVVYRQDGKESITLTNIDEMVTPLDSEDIRRVRLRGCDV